MRGSFQRWLSAFVLLAWMAPGAGALAVLVHLAADHHAAPGHHESEISELLRAATHGHHHDAEAAPRHEHEVRIDGPAPVVRSLPLPALLLPGSEPPPHRPSCRSPRHGSARRAPPPSLFAAHCSLLL